MTSKQNKNAAALTGGGVNNLIQLNNQIKLNHYNSLQQNCIYNN